MEKKGVMVFERGCVRIGEDFKGGGACDGLKWGEKVGDGLKKDCVKRVKFLLVGGRGAWIKK